MGEHKVTIGKSTFILNLPNYLDNKTRDLIIRIMKYCVDEEDQKKVLLAVKTLDGQVKHILKTLKKTNKYDKSIEKGIREFVGIHINQGFELGLSYSPRQGRNLVEIIADELEYKPIISNLPKSKQGMADIVFNCLDLARLAYETGVMLSYFISDEFVKQHQKQLKKEVWYIG